jgi:hypothetical protein
MAEQKIEQPKVSHICLSSEHNTVCKIAFTQATHGRTGSYRRLPHHWIIQNLSDKTLGKWLGDSHHSWAVAVPASGCYPSLLLGHRIRSQSNTHLPPPKKIQALWCGKIHLRDSGGPVMSEIVGSCQASCLFVVGTLVDGPHKNELLGEGQGCWCKTQT